MTPLHKWVYLGAAGALIIGLVMVHRIELPAPEKRMAPPFTLVPNPTMNSRMPMPAATLWPSDMVVFNSAAIYACGQDGQTTTLRCVMNCGPGSQTLILNCPACCQITDSENPNEEYVDDAPSSVKVSPSGSAVVTSSGPDTWIDPWSGWTNRFPAGTATTATPESDAYDRGKGDEAIAILKSLSDDSGESDALLAFRIALCPDMPEMPVDKFTQSCLAWKGAVDRRSRGHVK